MEKNNDKTYWPHMILGFLFVGITLSYWTVKSASSMPVQESNNYMMKYQQADMHINEILMKKQAFDNEYTIKLQDAQMILMKDNINAKRKQTSSVKLSQGSNDFSYIVETKDGSLVADANVTFLLTRPHNRAEDTLLENVPFVDGSYKIKNFDITKAGRYTLQLRAAIGEKIGYSEIEAYLKPQ